MDTQSRSKETKFLRNLGIFILMQISKTGLEYDENLILDAMHFWEGSTNTMKLKYGMLTSILFDVAAIIGLPSTGETYDPNRESKIQFKLGTIAYGAFIHEYSDKNTTEVSD